MKTLIAAVLLTVTSTASALDINVSKFGHSFGTFTKPVITVSTISAPIINMSTLSINRPVLNGLDSVQRLNGFSGFNAPSISGLPSASSFNIDNVVIMRPVIK